jgi:hypothetical protein
MFVQKKKTAKECFRVIQLFQIKVDSFSLTLLHKLHSKILHNFFFDAKKKQICTLNFIKTTRSLFQTPFCLVFFHIGVFIGIQEHTALQCLALKEERPCTTVFAFFSKCKRKFVMKVFKLGS